MQANRKEVVHISNCGPFSTVPHVPCWGDSDINAAAANVGNRTKTAHKEIPSVALPTEAAVGLTCIRDADDIHAV